MAANFTPVVNNEYWKKSWFITHLSASADQLMAWIEQSGFIPENSATQKR
jgi:hypothetical protein